MFFQYSRNLFGAHFHRLERALNNRRSIVQGTIVVSCRIISSIVITTLFRLRRYRSAINFASQASVMQKIICAPKNFNWDILDWIQNLFELVWVFGLKIMNSFERFLHFIILVNPPGRLRIKVNINCQLKLTHLGWIVLAWRFSTICLRILRQFGWVAAAAAVISSHAHYISFQAPMKKLVLVKIGRW